MAGRHLDCCVPKLRAAGKDAILFDGSITEKLSQFVDFLPGGDSFAFQPLHQSFASAARSDSVHTSSASISMLN
jgi:hypothetical protein